LQLAFDYRWLFWLDGLSFFLFGWVILLGIRETKPPEVGPLSPRQGYLQALRDRRFQLYLLINIMFTTYVAQLETAVPLYITRFTGGTTGTVTVLFTINLIAMAAVQIPVIKWLKSDRHAQALGRAAIIWGLSFVAVALATFQPSHSLGWLVMAMLGIAVALAAYNPTASALTADIAPDQLMGVYTSLNSLCWAVGFAIGPPIGGWALDQTIQVVQGFWLCLSIISVGMWLLLQMLDRLLIHYAAATIDT
jgi:MFS family permease